MGCSQTIHSSWLQATLALTKPNTQFLVDSPHETFNMQYGGFYYWAAPTGCLSPRPQIPTLKASHHLTSAALPWVTTICHSGSTTSQGIQIVELPKKIGEKRTQGGSQSRCLRLWNIFCDFHFYLRKISIVYKGNGSKAPRDTKHLHMNGEPQRSGHVASLVQFRNTNDLCSAFQVGAPLIKHPSWHCCCHW